MVQHLCIGKKLSELRLRNRDNDCMKKLWSPRCMLVLGKSISFIVPSIKNF